MGGEGRWVMQAHTFLIHILSDEAKWSPTSVILYKTIESVGIAIYLQEDSKHFKDVELDLFPEVFPIGQGVGLFLCGMCLV